jgi:hypothetical protein
MSTIKVHVTLYGSLARLAGGHHIAERVVELPNGACKADLLTGLGVPPEERGYLFINAVLCDLPGLETDGQDPLSDRDHVGIFSITYMWPYQYRDGVRMSESLKKALEGGGSVMHNVYTQQPDQEVHPL